MLRVSQILLARTWALAYPVRVLKQNPLPTQRCGLVLGRSADLAFDSILSPVGEKRSIAWRVVFPVLVTVAMVFSLPGVGIAQEEEVLPLAGAGSYSVGAQQLTFIDDSRDNRELRIAVWYPAIEPAGVYRRSWGTHTSRPGSDQGPPGDNRGMPLESL